MNTKPFAAALLLCGVLAAVAPPALATSTYTYYPPQRAARSSWYSPDWNYRIKITVNHDQVGEDLVDFPMLVNITNNQKLFKNTRGDGYDLLFTSSDGTTKLDHEIESYNADSQTLVAWVKIPKLSVTEDTSIFLYYGNAKSEDQQRPTNVWGDSYDVVYHMNQDPAGIIQDSEKASRNATSSGGMNRNDDVQDAKIGKGLFFDGTNDYLQVGNQPFAAYGTKDFLWSMWFKDQGATTNQALLIGKDHSTSASTRQIGFQLNTGFSGLNKPGTILVGLFEGDSKLITVQSPLGMVSPNIWNHVVFERHNGTIQLFYNGKEQPITYSSFGGATMALSIRDSSANLEIGAREYVGFEGYYKGLMDDVRFGKVARTSGWIATEYRNQNDPASFYTLTTQQTKTTQTILTPLLFTYTALSSFTQQATLNSGTILYQLSPDNGKTWYYLKNTTWTTVKDDTTATDPSSINKTISTLPSGTHQLKTKAFLHPKDAQPVTLEQLTFTYTAGPATGTTTDTPSLLKTGLVTRVNEAFQTMYKRIPTYTEWVYWAQRVLNKEKKTFEALVGAMAWHRVRP